MSVVAPHLVERLPFVFPLYADGPHRPWFVRTGVLALLGARAREAERPRRARSARCALVPQLRTEGLHSSALYADAWTNDGRLTIANVRGAAERGAVVLNYAEVDCVRAGGADVQRRRPNGRRCARARSSTRRARGSTGSGGSRIRTRTPSVRLSKGVHVVVDGGEGWSAAVTIPHDKVRVSFAIPWEGKLLLGTTDTLHEGEPEDGRVTDDDVRHDPRRGGGRDRRPRAGRGVVLRAARAARRARRDRERAPRDRLHDAAAGMLSVAGGKLTTYRRIALDALDAARRAQPRPRAAAAARRDRARTDPVAGRARPGDARAPAAPLRVARRRRCSSRRSTTRRCSSRSFRAGPTCVHRSCYAREHEWARTRRGRAAPPHDRLARSAQRLTRAHSC